MNVAKICEKADNNKNQTDCQPRIRKTITGKDETDENRANRYNPLAIRSPHRPNHIGFSIVKIERIEENRMYFTQVDVLDQTPVLDIKPYIKYFDNRTEVKCGWVEKHF